MQKRSISYEGYATVLRLTFEFASDISPKPCTLKEHWAVSKKHPRMPGVAGDGTRLRPTEFLMAGGEGGGRGVATL